MDLTWYQALKMRLNTVGVERMKSRIEKLLAAACVIAWASAAV